MRGSVAAAILVAVLVGLGVGYLARSYQLPSAAPSTAYSTVTRTVPGGTETVTETVPLTTVVVVTSPATTTVLSTITSTLTYTTTTTVSAVTTVTKTVTTSTATTATTTVTTTATKTTTVTNIPPLVLAEASTPSPDTQYHGGHAHAGFIDSEGPVNLTQIQAVNLEIGSGSDLGLTAYSPDVIFAANPSSYGQNNIALYDMQTESLETTYWAYNNYLPIASGAAIYYDYLGSGLPNLFCVYWSSSQGWVYWWHSGNGVGPYITVYGGLVIDAGGDSMEALNIADGSVLWTNNYLTSNIGYTTGTVTTIPTVGGNVIVVGMTSPNLVIAFNASNGHYLWSINLNSTTINSAPAYSGGYFYFTAGDHLYKVSLNGTIAWERDLGVPAMDTPAVAYGALYLGTSSGLLLAINATTGSVVWYDSLGSSIAASPIVSTNQVVYEGTMGGMVYAVSAENGTILSSYDIGAPVETNPVLVDGYLLVLDNDGVLHVFKP